MQSETIAMKGRLGGKRVTCYESCSVSETFKLVKALHNTRNWGSDLSSRVIIAIKMIPLKRIYSIVPILAPFNYVRLFGAEGKKCRIKCNQKEKR